MRPDVMKEIVVKRPPQQLLPQLPHHRRSPWKRIAQKSARIRLILSSSQIQVAQITTVAVRSALGWTATVPRGKGGARKKRLVRLNVKQRSATNQLLQPPLPPPPLPLRQGCQDPWKRIAQRCARIRLILTSSQIPAAPIISVAVRSG